MTRVLSIDCGLRMGFAALSDGYVRSGSWPIAEDTSNMGDAFRVFVIRMGKLALEYKPTIIATAMPFVGKKATPAAMLPIFGFPCRLHEFCNASGIPFRYVDEPNARKAFMNFVPRKSEQIKSAAIQACRDRGWPARDGHAADALCIASFVLSQERPDLAATLGPLFAKRKAA